MRCDCVDGLCGKALIGVIPLHLIAVLKHHLVSKDQTLRPMLGTEVSVAS